MIKKERLPFIYDTLIHTYLLLLLLLLLGVIIVIVILEYHLVRQTAMQSSVIPDTLAIVPAHGTSHVKRILRVVVSRAGSRVRILLSTIIAHDPSIHGVAQLLIQLDRQRVCHLDEQVDELGLVRFVVCDVLEVGAQVRGEADTSVVWIDCDCRDVGMP